MSEYQLHKSVVNFINLKYPKAVYRSDLSGVKMNIGTIAKMSALNKWKGFPDLIIYEPNGIFLGLAIELKQDGNTKNRGNSADSSRHPGARVWRV